VWQHPKDVRFASAAAPVGNLQQIIAREKVSNNTAVHKDAATRAPEATVATSSVCSVANGAAKDERWRQQKRKAQAECSASLDEVSEPFVMQYIGNVS
jgi:phytochrome-interacting factor 3